MTNQLRRDFLKRSGLGLIGAWIGSALTGGRALAQGGAKAAPTPAGGGAKLEMVKESDALAKSLGYYEDAAKVDVKKWPKRSGPEGKKQFCYNCQFYKVAGDPAESDAAPCQIFANKGVKGKGW